MIRAGRRHLVQTVTDLASAHGKTRHKEPGHPAPISSPGARSPLFDKEQTDAFYAGKPVPALPETEDEEDLLDRHEAAAELDVTARSWNLYKHNPGLADHVVKVPSPAGTEHWPRRVVAEFKASRPGKGPRGGRPRKHGDVIPRDQVRSVVAQLLEEDPAVTAQTVVNQLGVAMTTAMRALAQLRGERIADLLQEQPGLEPGQAAEQLGYPPLARRRALLAAEQELRSRQVQPYLQRVADALAAEQLAEPAEVEVQQLPTGTLTAVIYLLEDRDQALVWDERYGWRTPLRRPRVTRRHAIGKDTGVPPEGEGIRYLGTGRMPVPAELIEALRNPRRGSKQPRKTYPAGGALDPAAE